MPLYGGLRLTGRAGGVGLGALSMQSEAHDGAPSQNYSVARVRRDVFGSSDIGAIVMSRQAAGSSDDFNRVVGADANFRVLKSLNLNGFAARVRDPRRGPESDRRRRPRSAGRTAGCGRSIRS